MHWCMDCMKMVDIRRMMKTKTRGCIIVYVMYTYDGFINDNPVLLRGINNVKMIMALFTNVAVTGIKDNCRSRLQQQGTASFFRLFFLFSS